MRKPHSREKTSDCYSAGERTYMELTQKMRGVLLRPLLSLLTVCRINADGLTLLSLLAGLAACPAYYYGREYFLLLLLLHVVLDGLDGPLARYQKTASRRGSFTDTMSDQIVVAATTITLIYDGVAGVIPGVAYVFLYTVIIAFSMIRNAMGIPYRWLIRPRFTVYVWLVVEFYIRPGTVDYLLWFFTVVLALAMARGFYRIRKKL